MVSLKIPTPLRKTTGKLVQMLTRQQVRFTRRNSVSCVWYDMMRLALVLGLHSVVSVNIGFVSFGDGRW